MLRESMAHTSDTVEGPVERHNGYVASGTGVDGGGVVQYGLTVTMTRMSVT